MRRFKFNKSGMKKVEPVVARSGVKVRRDGETSYLVGLEQAPHFSEFLRKLGVKFLSERGAD